MSTINHSSQNETGFSSKKIMATVVGLLVIIATAKLYNFLYPSWPSHYSHFLPKESKVVMVAPSLFHFFDKMDLKENPQVAKQLTSFSKNMFGDNVFQTKFYINCGVDIEKPLGIALVGSPSDLRVIVFMRVISQTLWEDFIKTRAREIRDRPLEHQSIGPLSCWLDNTNRPSFIAAYQKSYGFLYWSNNPTKSKENFRQDLIDKTEKMISQRDFHSLLSQRSLGDAYAYINVKKVLPLLRKQIPAEQAESFSLFVNNWAKDVSSALFTAEFKGRRFTSNAYYLAAGKQFEQLTNKDIPFLDLVGNPLFAQYFQIMAKPPKEDLSKILEALPPQFEEEKQLFIDIAEALSPHLKDHALFAVHDLVDEENNLNMEFLLAAGIQEKSQEQLQQTLSDLAKVIRLKWSDKITLHSFALLGDRRGYTFSLNGSSQQQALLSPTIGIVKDTLLLASRQEMFQALVQQEYPLERNYYLEKKMRESLALGTLKLSAVWQEVKQLKTQNTPLLPQKVFNKGDSILSPIEEIYWETRSWEKGIIQQFVIRTDNDILETILKNVTGVAF